MLWYNNFNQNDMENLSIKFEKDYANKKITVKMAYKAPLGVVWDAFTNPAILDKWFAPEPYKAVSKSMEFKNNGQWLYHMLSPEGEKFWCKATFMNIREHKSFEASDGFCDENGVVNNDLPHMHWRYDFAEDNGAIVVTANITFENEEMQKQTLEMGFEEGYKMGLKQLQKLLEK